MKNNHYEVGYKKPPKHTMFKKGQSGNPKGRPPKKVFHENLIDILNENITLTMNGEKVTMTRKEAFLYQLTTEALKGKSTAASNLIHILKHLDQIPPL